MLDIKYLRQNIDFVVGKMRERGQEMNLERFIALDAKRRDIIQEVEGLRSERNTVSKEIGEKKKNREDATEIIARMGAVSNRIKELDETLKADRRGAPGDPDDDPQYPARVGCLRERGGG